jgi:hypothetical protein
VPDNVRYVESMYDNMRDRYVVRWLGTDNSRHSMDCDASEDGMQAVIATMRLSC